MEALKKKLENTHFEKIDLGVEFEKSMQNPVFQDIVKKTKLPKEELQKYTSFLEDAKEEYSHCLECKNLLDCPNRVRGHVYFPVVRNKQLDFEYKPCSYQIKLEKKTKYQKNIRFFEVPTILKEASMDSIYKTDKSRYEAILWIGDFLKKYEENPSSKGLYLYGNFGCGKSYLLAALLNELAKQNHVSAMVFWPEFLRQAFYDDFKEKFEYVKKVPILLIDDIGAENVTAWNRDEILCPLLQYRMEEGLTTFFTSNLSLENLEQHLSNSKSGVEEIKAGRIISRIEQLAMPLEMISKNLRK